MHPRNAADPILVMLVCDKSAEVSPLHLLNAPSPMLVNPSGKVTEVSPVHS